MNEMMQNQPEEMMRWLDTAFAPTPEEFHTRVEKQLFALRVQSFDHPVRKKVRWVPLVAAFILLVSVAAFAASRLGVLYFLTQRTNVPADEALVQEQMVSPVFQDYESDYFVAEVRDAIFSEDSFTLCVHVTPKETETYALLCEMDIGTDGEHMQQVWHGGKVYNSLAEWTPQEKQALVVNLPKLQLGGYALFSACDYVPEGDGITFMLEADVSTMDILHDVTVGDLVKADGTIDVSVTLESLTGGDEEMSITNILGTIPYHKLEEE